jgi:hypothetical protein
MYYMYCLITICLFYGQSVLQWLYMSLLLGKLKMDFLKLLESLFGCLLPCLYHVVPSHQGWAVGAAIGHPRATVTAMLLGTPLCTLMSTIVCRLMDSAKQSLITVGVPTPQDMGLPD